MKFEYIKFYWITNMVYIMFENFKDDFELISIKNGFILNWSAKDIGFGQFVFKNSSDGKMVCDNECMHKEMIKNILCRMVDTCELRVDNG